MENANLHRDLSIKIELVLSQQKQMESLSEECQSLSQALQRMSAEMLDLRNDLEIYKDVVIPSMEERSVEQEDKIQDLTLSNERHEDEISRLKAELKDTKSDLLRAHERSSTLEMELIVNVEMLKHVIGLFEASKTQLIALSDKPCLQEEEHESLEQMLATVTNENKLFSNKLAWVIKERDCFAAEMRWLVAMLADVEQLQRELTSARMGTPVARHTDIGGGSPANFYDLSDQQRGVNVGVGESLRSHHQNIKSSQFLQEEFQVPASALTLSTEEGDWDLKTKKEFSAKGEKMQQASGPVDSDLGSSSTTQSSSSLCVIDKLKEEITFMQMSIQKLEAAVGDRESQDLLSTTHGNLCNPGKNSTISSASILVEDDVEGGSDKFQNLSEENHSLRAENISLKAECQAARIEWTLLQDTMRDLEASKLILQEKNDHLYSVADSDKRDTLKLQDQFIQLQQTYSTLLQDVEASHEQRKKSEETLHMLDDVIGSLESSNRRLHVENGLKAEELKNLRDILANVHNEGAGGVAELRTKMAEAFDELKTMIIDCSGKMEDDGVFQFLMDSESLAVLELPHQNVTNVSIESSDERRMPEVTPDTTARCRHFLTELKSSVEEANILVEVLLGVRKMMSICLESSERDGGTSFKPKDEVLMKGDERVRRRETCSIEKDPDPAGSVHQHIKLAEQIQAFIDTKLEHEFLELKQGRNKLKKDLALQFDEVHKIEIEVKKLEILLKSDGRITQEETKGKKRRAEECVTELQGMLAELRVQVHRMRKEIVFEEDEDVIGVEGQVTVLVSTDSAPSMDVWKGKLMKEVEGLRLLNRRLYAELQTSRQDLENMATMIKSAHSHLLQESSGGEEEIVSSFDLRTQKSDTSGLRAQNSRESTDSQQQLVFASPQMVEGDLLSIHRTGSEGSPRQFPLKPRNFGFTWFMLLFSPDRKVSNIIRGKTGKEVSPSSRGSRRSGRANATLVMDSGRRKVSGCWTCTSRLDSFDHR